MFESVKKLGNFKNVIQIKLDRGGKAYVLTKRGGTVRLHTLVKDENGVYGAEGQKDLRYADSAYMITPERVVELHEGRISGT